MRRLLDLVISLASFCIPIVRVVEGVYVLVYNFFAFIYGYICIMIRHTWNVQYYSVG